METYLIKFANLVSLKEHASLVYEFGKTNSILF